jgi:Ca2+-binding EF-hand superfamily protein
LTNQLLLSLLLASMASPALPQANAAPVKGPQPISRTVFLSRADSLFAAADANKDGFTDRAEIEAAEAKALAARKANQLKQREAAFRQLDKDKNGTLSLTEFNAVPAQTAKPNATATLTRLDKNKDGKISREESRAPAEAQFARLDANKDGILSVEEQRRTAGTRR